MRVIILAVLFCGAALPALAQDVSAVRQASQKFTAALSGGDAAAAAAMFTDDGYVLPPGRKELKGKSDIQMFLNGMTHAVQNLQYMSEDVQPVSDSVAREVGTVSFKMKGRQGGTPQDVSGKYLLIWVKSGSDWKISTDMWNRSSQAGAGGKGGRAKAGAGQGLQPQNDAQ